MNIVQTATDRTSTLVVGGDLGPGTRAFITASCGFTNPVTAGNSILAFITGRIPMAGSTLTLGPFPNGSDYLPGGSLSGGVPAGDVCLYFGSNRAGNSVDTVSRGSLAEQQQDGGAASGCLYTETLGAGGPVSATFSYSVPGSGGNFQAIVDVTGSPTLRGTSSVSGSASSFTINLPTGSQAGDFAVLFAAGGWYPQPPSGWNVQIQRSGVVNWNGGVFYRTLTSSDVSSGTVTVPFSGGSFDAVLAMATLHGTAPSIREANHSDNSSAASSVTVSADSAVYYVQVTYVDAGGNETAAGPESAIVVPANNILRVFPPANPNFTSGHVPGAVGWNLYASLTTGAETKQNASVLSFATPWVEPTSGLVTGAAPPTSPIQDVTGNVYARSFWTDGTFFGTAQGAEAMGVFFCPISAPGTPTISFRCVALNANPFFDVTADVDIVLFEIASFSDATVQDVEYFKQNSSVGAPTVTTARSTGSLITQYGPRADDAGLVINFLSAGQDNIFALLTGDYMPEPVAAPTTVAGIYSVVARLPSTDGFPLYIWLLSPRKGRPQFFVVL